MLRPMENTRPIGDHLRDWRQRRRLSQLDLALEADISAKHLSFLETGRAQPSREMVLHLAERLDIPLRERNVLLLSAGYAPVFAQRPLGRSGAASCPSCRRPCPERARAVSGDRGRPALDPDRAQRRGTGADRRGRSESDAAAGQRAAPEPAPERASAAHRQPAGVARAPVDAPASADRRDGGRRTDQASGRTLGLSGARRRQGTARDAERRLRRCRGAGAASSPTQACCRSSRRRRSSARRSTSRSRSWRSSRSSRPTPRRPRSYAAIPGLNDSPPPRMYIVGSSIGPSFAQTTRIG